MDKICPYLLDKSTSIKKRGICKIDNNICAYIRFCPDKNCILSSELYIISGCLKQIKYESEIKNV